MGVAVTVGFAPLAGPGPPPGDHVALEDLARRLGRVADALAGAVRLLPGTQVTGWRGAAAGAFLEVLGVQVRRLREASDVYAVAARVLAGYVSDLPEAQSAVAVAASADHVSGVLEGLVAAAPRHSAARDSLGRLATWRAEIGLGIGESLEGLAGLAVRWTQLRALTDPAGFVRDGQLTVSGLLDAGRHPGRAAGELVDADTWRHNPARAVGRLVPDLAAGALSGGSATVARRSLAEVGRSARQAGLRAAAAERRSGMVEAAVRQGRAVQRGPWHGDGGLRLPAEVHAAAQAYRRAVQAAEPQVTRRMRGLARAVGGRLVGLEYRLKTAESLNRKLATAGAGATSGTGDLVRALESQQDTLRYTLVFGTRRYPHAVAAAGARLDRSGMSLTRLRNTWDGPGYRGINTSWTDPGTGVRFEIQFHTPTTRRATLVTHPWYERFRAPGASEALRRELAARIDAEYATARRPPRVERFTPDGASLADRPGYAADAAATAAAGVHVAGTGGVQSDPVSCSRRPGRSARPAR
jgi:hypothetical protein